MQNKIQPSTTTSAIIVSMMLKAVPDRIFIDATYTIGSGKSSGIERVVRNLLRECAALGNQGRIPKPRLVLSHAGKFYEATDQQVAEFGRTASMQANVLATTSELYRGPARLLCDMSRSERLRKWLLPQPGHLGMFKLAHSWRELKILRKLAHSASPVVGRQGDLFLLPDAYWINRLRHSVWPAAAEARQLGAVVASVIYDLIPLTHPEFVGLKRRDAFLDYLKKAARNSDLLVAISNTVRDQLTQQLREFATPVDSSEKRIRSFQLGAELRNATGPVRPDLQQLFAPCHGKTPYLTVATFDPRKNHKYLLDGFNLLWKKHTDIQLCLVGRIGSRCDDIIARIAQHPRLGKQLHLFDDLSDAELHHCYENARGVVFPSIVEGFGLPIVESLWFGKKTFVSDTEIHREVGRDDCCYFNLACASSLADCITGWEQNLASTLSPTLPARRPVSWEESCDQIVSHCLDAYHDRQETGCHKSAAA